MQVGTVGRRQRTGGVLATDHLLLRVQREYAGSELLRDVLGVCASCVEL